MTTGVPVTQDPFIQEVLRCKDCGGSGKQYRFTQHDRRYPIQCPQCDGKGTQ